MKPCVSELGLCASELCNQNYIYNNYVYQNFVIRNLYTKLCVSELCMPELYTQELCVSELCMQELHVCTCIHKLCIVERMHSSSGIQLELSIHTRTMYTRTTVCINN